jgi:hypothetical protein
MRFITNIVEPNRLKLVWQGVNASVRTKFVVGELIRAGSNVSLCYHRQSADFHLAKGQGFVGHPAFNYDVGVHHTNVVEVFSKRLPHRSRTDFRIYLEKNRLQQFPFISDLALLGYSGARLPGDGFSLEIDYLYEEMPLQFLMEVAGFRYYSGMHMDLSSLTDWSVTFLREPANQYDPYAVQIYVGGSLIGYVPRPHSASVWYWLQHDLITATVERVDGAKVRPEVYLFVQVWKGASSVRNALLPSS